MMMVVIILKIMLIVLMIMMMKMMMGCWVATYLVQAGHQDDQEETIWAQVRQYVWVDEGMKEYMATCF